MGENYNVCWVRDWSNAEGVLDLGFITNPKNGRVKALSKACLDRTYL